MFPVPQHEKLIETKVCRQCQTSFPITDKDMELYDRLSPVFGNKKYSLPTAKICPDCRQKRRMAFRNERKLYRRNCDATGKEIISTYSPEAKVVVFHHDEWWSDKWDPLVYGKSFDFEKSFFEQFSALFSRVPKMGLLSFNNINSPYANYAANNKDIYMSPDILDSENVLYSNTIKKSTNCIDLLDVVDASECYECIGSQRVYNCQHVYWSADCTECYYVHGCHNVKNSLFCTNLNNKNYHILNKQSTKEEYEIVLQAIRTGQHGEYFKQYQQLLLSSPQKHLRTYQIENVSGDIIKESINCVSCFQSILLQDCRYVVTGYEMKNCMDTSIHNPNCEYDYEAISGGGLVRAICNNMCGYSDNLYYNNECLHGSHLFGCIGLRNKKYCILNKQYTKEEYEALVPKIIEKMIADGEWGEFFPASLSPFGYNETVAAEYFPLEKSDALKLGFNWSDYEAPFPKVEKIIPASKLPDDITKIPDDILNWAIECEVTGKPFRIIKQELEFYRKHNLPIPRRHPDQRHADRMALRNPRKLFERKCDKCSNDILTTYAPERTEIVYCEGCYEKEIV